MHPISCRSRWKWMHSCVTKDGKKHLSVAQWHGFVMVFIVKECFSFYTPSLWKRYWSFLLPSQPIWSPDSWVLFPRLTESVNGNTSDEGVLTVAVNIDKRVIGHCLGGFFHNRPDETQPLLTLISTHYLPIIHHILASHHSSTTISQNYIFS